MSSENPPAAPDARRRRSAARLAAVQALYQQSMSGTATPRLLNEFHNHRLGAELDAEEGGDRLADADRAFFDDLVAGSVARTAELDETITRFLGAGWSIDRLDKLMLQILRCGAYEMLARADVPRAAVVSEYVDVAHAFYEQREAGFVNALLDRLGKSVRAD
jgi:N utilization substance protein B